MTGRIVGVLLGCSFVLSAAAVPIGVLMTVDSARIDNSEVRGNGSVLNGSTVETLKNPSRLRLKNGAQFELYANSRATVYEDRLVLERGASQIHSSAVYSVLVNSLSILSVGPASTVRISRNNPRTLEVAAVAGRAEVRNAKGVLIANVFPGSALAFDQPPAGAAGPSQVSGKVSKQDGHFMLTDSTTNTTVELQGDNLDSVVGHRIAVTGAADPSAIPAAGATQLIHVASFKLLSFAQAGGGTAASGGAAAAGLSHAVIGGVFAAVAAGGTLGGLAAAGEFRSGS